MPAARNPYTVTGIRASNEPSEGLVALEITVGYSRRACGKDRPGERPGSGSSPIGCVSPGTRPRWVGPARRIRFDVPKGQLEDFIRDNGVMACKDPA
jgi:hypothetical protein